MSTPAIDAARATRLHTSVNAARITPPPPQVRRQHLCRRAVGCAGPVHRHSRLGNVVITTLADAELVGHRHRNRWEQGTFGDLAEARFVLAVHAGHGPSCHQYLSALESASVVCG